MKKIPILLFFLYCFAEGAFAQFYLKDSLLHKKYFQQKVDYKIDVTLNDVSNTLDGFELLNYTNNSPDTLHYIWFHVWPNAYKNDKTAFSEQLLKLGRTDYYFSDEEMHGYLNRLEFKVNNVTVKVEDHPQYIDVIKLILPSPLAPGSTIKISSPFHEKLPHNFSRGGYVNHTYQVTQWYPKPAVYDAEGWHEMPYLDQGEFYSEFGNYAVQITVPKDYVVAATGDLQNDEEKQWLIAKAKNHQELIMNDEHKKPLISKTSLPKKKALKNKKNGSLQTIKSNHKSFVKNAEPQQQQASQETKTLTYIQDSVHDFAWFADKNFLVMNDTLQLQSGKIINAWSFCIPKDFRVWHNSVQFIKDAVRTRSTWLGEYPYNNVTAIEAKLGFNGGMEYPTITSIAPMYSEKDLDLTIEHEVGHNWNYGILATNERQHPWMDEGMNTYFDNRYKAIKYPEKTQPQSNDLINKKMSEDETDLYYRTEIANKKDQPIETSSEDFSAINYDLIAYYKTGIWMKVLEDYVGQPLFDSCLHEYYDQWKFKHLTPEDFKNIVAAVSKKNVDSVFKLLYKKGDITPKPKKEFKLSAFFNFKNTDKYNYIFLSPAIGLNYYDKLMIGGIIHNYTLPQPHFHFILAPLYATASNTFNGIGKIGYNYLSYGFIRKAELSISAEKFTEDEYTDSTGTKNYLGFSKITPALKIIFKNKNATSSVINSVQWKTFFIKETGLLFTTDTITNIQHITYPETKRYINQLQLETENGRALYPYSALLQAEQSTDFVRLAFEGKYFFNYAKNGGLDVRLFAGKFMYLGDKTITKEFETDRYHLNMTGANGYEDYTYSNYFVGRNEFQGASSQQITIRDGGFKVRTDLLSSKVGKTDNWLAAVNLKTGFPKAINPLQVLPIKIPLYIFLDAGTYAEAWENNAPTGKFIYDAGLQLSLIKNLLNVYVPVIYSKVYADYFKSTITGNRFWKNISFSIDIQNFRFNKFFNRPQL